MPKARSPKPASGSKPSPAQRQRFRKRLLAWFDRAGRKDLPWKRTRDPYHVWLSEIMLQQTQVVTVIPYFTRFIARFPTIQALASARADTVMRHWAGLGYYARARNLHAAAKEIVREHSGKFPREFEHICALPGVGRSTAGAIAAQAFDARHAILDGNVKRVLARQHAISTPLNDRATEMQLWQLADSYTPAVRVADYTQAIMDLGATICRPRQPNCPHCPVATECQARAADTAHALPIKRKAKPLPIRRTKMLLLTDRNRRVLLIRRPPTGIWGGLWSLPEWKGGDVRAFCRHAFGLEIKPARAWPTLRHSFSHFHLDITPIPARLLGPSDVAMENAEHVWYNPGSRVARAVATPVQRLLEQLKAR